MGAHLYVCPAPYVITPLLQASTQPIKLRYKEGKKTDESREEVGFRSGVVEEK